MFSFETDNIDCTSFIKPKKISVLSNGPNHIAKSNISYSNSMILNQSSALLTPTSPITLCAPIQTQLPPAAFQQNEYQTLITKNVTDEFSTTNYSADNSGLNDLCSYADTPNSVQSTTPANKYSPKDDYFKFEPEYIELFQQSCYNELDTEYMNYDEVNCQSKAQSLCSSPNLDPWMCINLDGSMSPKQENTMQMLPSIKTLSPQFQRNSALLCEYTIPSGQIINNETSPIPVQDYNQCFTDNFNYDTWEKPSREFKNIWSPEVSDTPHSPIDNNSVSNSVNDTELIDIPTVVTSTITIQTIAARQPVDNNAANETSTFPTQCLWKNCLKHFSTQSSLVEHIEKCHVELRKGEEFACHWYECPRRNKPFNARYKLLIHMRVHSGEKPNKCQVRTFNIFMSINLKLKKENSQKISTHV